MRIRWISLIALFSLALGGCGPSQVIGQSPELALLNPQDVTSFPTLSSDSLSQGEIQMTPPLSTHPASGLEVLIEKAKEDLAQRLSISAIKINLVEAKPVVWPDSSLGCPQPGMAYAQVLTPGYLIRLEAGGKEYQYHASRNANLIFCENPAPPVPGMPGDT